MRKNKDRNRLNILCLGDSYTIGEGVKLKETFIHQFINFCKIDNKATFEKPKIIAKTGWTTDELISSIKRRKLLNNYDLVTILIGVNNQYRKYNIETYKKEFTELVEFALKKTKKNEKLIYVISIPDWGHTQFLPQDKYKRSLNDVSKEINIYNDINKKISSKYNLNYIDITKISRKAISNPNLTTLDLLHPSAQMYFLWAQQLYKKYKLNYEY